MQYLHNELNHFTLLPQNCGPAHGHLQLGHTDAWLVHVAEVLGLGVGVGG